MSKVKKKKSPSRAKYERSHPTRSFRSSKELDDRIEAIKKAENMSVTDIVKVAVGLLKVKISDLPQLHFLDNCYYECQAIGQTKLAVKSGGHLRYEHSAFTRRLI